MTTYSAVDLGNLWIAAGGDPQWARRAEVVALAESGGTPGAISATSDYGLWQINLPLHLGQAGISWTNWMTPVVNAQAAILISNNGTDWGPWCTAWANPQDCASGPLADPQAGSPAGVILASLGGEVSTPGTGAVESGQTAAMTTLAEVWQRIQDTAGPYANDQLGRLLGAAAVIQGG